MFSLAPTKAEIKRTQARQQKHWQTQVASAQSARQLLSPAEPVNHQNHATVLSNKHIDKYNIKTYQHPDTFDVAAIASWLSTDYVRSVKKTGYLNASKRLKDKKRRIKFSGFNCTWDDDKLKDHAQHMSHHCTKHLARLTKTLTKHSNPLLIQLKNAEAMITEHQLSPIPVDTSKPKDIEAALNRYTCPYWWRRQLRKLQSQRIEQLARELNVVSYNKQPYCSDVMHGVKQSRDEANRKLLETMVAIANEGLHNEHMVELVKAVDASISNPMIRAAELMVRMRGCEEIATDKGYIGEFVTWTAPSQFHSTNRNGQPNKHYLPGLTAKHAQTYFTEHWKKAYALLLKYQIKPFGFRVVEPHHDGCPHWHMLLFIAPEQVARFRHILKAKALELNPEQVAHNPDIRIKFVSMKPELGTAAGYIAKYITKGINGYQLKHVKDGKQHINLHGFEAAKRIKTNLSSHGIRQFQPIGQPPVTVWRELRRLGKGIDGQRTMSYQLNDQLKIDSLEHFALENLRRAADAGDWRGFCQAMGGVQIKREDHTARISYYIPQVLNKLTNEYELRTNRYGEVAQKRVSGINWEKLYLCTRLNEYKLTSKAEIHDMNKRFMTMVSNCFDIWDKADVYVEMAEREFDQILLAAEQYESQIERLWLLSDDSLLDTQYTSVEPAASREGNSGGLH